MTRYTKLLSLLSIAVVTPIVFSSAANAQYRTGQYRTGQYHIEQSDIQLTPPNCQLIDCDPRPVIVVPELDIPEINCDPRFCDPVDFKINRAELDGLSTPVLEDSIRLGELQNVGRLR